jgi:hypothetical protein
MVRRLSAADPTKIKRRHHHPSLSSLAAKTNPPNGIRTQLIAGLIALRILGDSFERSEILSGVPAYAPASITAPKICAINGTLLDSIHSLNSRI